VLAVAFAVLVTSPLYTLRIAVDDASGMPAVPSNVLGLISIIWWLLATTVGLKYLHLLARPAVGGICRRHGPAHVVAKSRTSIGPLHLQTALALAGLTLLIGDAFIVPVISLTSVAQACLGAGIAAEQTLLPMILFALLGLLIIQICRPLLLEVLCGLVICLWLLITGGLGLASILETPQILRALDPRLALQFLFNNGMDGLSSLSTLALCIFGAELILNRTLPLKAPKLQLIWYGVVFPLLGASYLGQGAALLRAEEAASQPFFAQIPQSASGPLAILALGAALATSACTLAAMVNFLTQPCTVESSEPATWSPMQQFAVRGVPIALLALGCLACIGLAGGPSGLIDTFGLAMSATMAISSILLIWSSWTQWANRIAGMAFLAVELAFVIGGLAKLSVAAWVPVGLGLVAVVLGKCWAAGHRVVRRAHEDAGLKLDSILQCIEFHPPRWVAGCAVYMMPPGEHAPAALVQQLRHLGALHEKVLLVTLSQRQHTASKVRVAQLGSGFVRVFVEVPGDEPIELPHRLMDENIQQSIGGFNPMEALYFLHDGPAPGLYNVSHKWRWLLRLLQRWKALERPCARRLGIAPGLINHSGKANRRQATSGTRDQETSMAE
jgi:KUP system potassium uptake protein